MLGEVDRGRVAWSGFGVALAAAVCFVVYSFVGTFVFGIFLYYATRPVYRQLKERLGHPNMAAAASLFTLALPFLLLLWYTVAIALQEINTIARGTDFGQYEAMLGPYLNVSAVAADPGTIYNDPSATQTIRNVLSQGFNYVGFLGNGALHVFVMIALAFYLLRDDYRISGWVRNHFADDVGVLSAYMRAVDQDFKSIFFGNILNALMTGVISALSYSVLNIFAPPEIAVPYAALIGLLAGAASLIPVVGMKLVYVPMAGYLFYDAATADATGLLWFPVVFTALSLVVVDVIPDMVLRPYVSGRNLHVGSVMFAYILGPLLFSWYGIFLGPMLLVLAVHFGRMVLPELVADAPLQPFAVDPSKLSEHTDIPDPATVPEEQLPDMEELLGIESGEVYLPEEDDPLAESEDSGSFFDRIMPSDEVLPDDEGDAVMDAEVDFGGDDAGSVVDGEDTDDGGSASLDDLEPGDDSVFEEFLPGPEESEGSRGSRTGTPDGDTD